MVLDLPYAFSSRSKVTWTPAQEKSLSTDYPFELDHESDHQYVVRTYLQFLWLPESIMPLNIFVPSLLRVCVPSPPQTSPHPLHILLTPLLQTTRSTLNKYHVELPQILSSGGGAGEIEETVMWYALNHELADDDLSERITDGPWEDPAWREAWLQRMERREVQIQILLHFLKLSLPAQPFPESTSPKKRKRKQAHTPAPLAVEDNLEAFMDKLSMWQLMSSLDNGNPSIIKDDLDWMQQFFTEIVNPQFASRLPETCTLLRTKIFRDSSFLSSSSPSSPSSSRAASPDISGHRVSSVITGHRDPSPAPSTTPSKAQAQVRSRSRSLSVSLAEERMRERERSVGVPKKRVLNREVSMSRGFKPKPKAMQDETRVETKKETRNNVVKERKEGVTLVEATPVKPKPVVVRTQSQPFFGITTGESASGDQRTQSSSRLLFGVWQQQEDDDDDDEWQVSSSPDVLSLGARSGARAVLLGGDDEESQDAGVRVLVRDTPTKKARLR